MHKYFSQEGFVELYTLTYMSSSTRIHTKIANQGKFQMCVKKKENVSKNISQRFTTQLNK